MNRSLWTDVWRSWQLGLLLSLCCAPSFAAEEFILRSGASIRGQWLNRTERPLKSYIIQTDQGGRVALAPQQVVRTVHRPAAEAEYDRIAPAHLDTTADQWKLAQWCREHRLRKRAALHFGRVVELEPDHVKARRALGYAQLHGRWVRHDEFLTERGYVQFQGRWRLTQEVELLQASQRVKDAERRWMVDTRRWRTQLGTDMARDALKNFQMIRDPHAIRALQRLLQKDRHRGVRLLCIDVLGHIEHERSTRLLLTTALNDTDEEIVHACIDLLVIRKTPELTKRFAEALTDADNQRVNRAGYALGRLQDDVAIEPLIEALVTTHLVNRSDPSGQAPGSTTAGFMRRNDTDQGAHFSVRNGPQLVELRRPNQGVLAGLEKLAGLSFGYDQRAWREWRERHRLRPSTPALGRTPLP